jgi:hypothetical protein
MKGGNMKIKIAKSFCQQGDVLLKRIQSLPWGEQKEVTKQRLVVAHGESGHSHVIENDGATMLLIGETFYLQLEKDSIIKHEEHKPIHLEKGIWEIGRVQEYDWFSKMVRQVVD